MSSFEEFQAFRKILCVCPNCGEIVRLSDLRLIFKGEVEKTWLDDFESRSYLLAEKERQFEKVESKLREASREEGRKQAQETFHQRISIEFRKMQYDPFDIKPILNPVDFVVFNGMNAYESISEIVFLSRQSENRIINEWRTQIQDIIRQDNYEWLVARIDNNGNISFE